MFTTTDLPRGSQRERRVESGIGRTTRHGRSIRSSISILLLTSIVLIVLATRGRGQDEQQEAIEFFEARIRPVFVAHCYECHSTETDASGGLVLDARQGWEQGGDSGPAIVPGAPEASLLWKAIRYEDPRLQMPPDGRLPANVVEDFRKWIAAGAIDPRESDAPQRSSRSSATLTVEEAHQHWAYRQLQRPSIPSGRGSPIDCFIDARLEQLGLSPAGPASPRVLARRLYFDLTGLPPSVSQLNEATALIEAGRLEELVDRLLASPRFGEHIARRWLDVVRYADSITLRGFILSNAWRYRDYVINSFNEDRPWDQMICEQVAGDLMTADNIEERQRQLVATGFLALGNTNLEQQDKLQLEMDYIDEQLQVIGSAFLAQTIGCARCHDHKFDPIPTRDYYAMAGILRSAVGMEHDNVSRWIEQPLPLPPEQQADFAALQQSHTEVERKLKQARQRLSELRGGRSDVIQIASLPGIVVDSQAARLVGTWKLSTYSKPYIGNGYLHDENNGKGQKTATFEPDALPPGEYEVRLAYTANTNRASNVPVHVFSAAGEKIVVVNQREQPPADSLWVSLGRYYFEPDGQAYVLVSNEGTNGHVIVDAVQFLPVAVADELAASRQSAQLAEANRREEVRLQQRIKQLETELKRLEAALSDRPKYLTVMEKRPASDIPVYIRGDVHNPGAIVPRGFLTAVAPRAERITSGEERPGRLDLARWIASSDNPLTARVYANRVWLWMMGDSLAGNPNNFGTTYPPPALPDLLDWLACELIDSGWSTKHLVRTIVLSQAYARRTQSADQQAQRIDPGNQYYWRANYKRLPVEAIRDAMLMVSGELDRAMGGSMIRAGTKADYNYVHQGTRRSVYHPVFRNSLPPLFAAFDFADPSVSVGQRGRSTVAPQVLVLLNDSWVQQRVEAATERLGAELERKYGRSADMAPRWCEELYLRLLSRSAEPEEIGVAVAALTGGTDRIEREGLRRLIHALFATIDFRYLE